MSTVAAAGSGKATVNPNVIRGFTVSASGTSTTYAGAPLLDATAASAGAGAVSITFLRLRQTITDRVILGELDYYDADTSSTGTLYISSDNYYKATTDTSFYNRLIKAPTYQQDMFDALRTSGRSRVGIGSAVLNNADHGLDAWLDYYFDGRQCRFYEGSKTAAYPSQFRPVFVGTMLPPDSDDETITLNFRDAQVKLEVPLQTNKYAGDNDLPNGVEGTSDLAGKPKPICLGSVLNVSPPCVNTDKLIFQVNDGEVSDISVYDGGVELGIGKIVGMSLASSGDSFTSANDIAAGAGVFVASGADTTSAFEGLMLSSDGDSWAQIHTLAGANPVVYGGSVFMAGGDDGAIATSTNGSSWTNRTTTAVFTSGDDVAGLTYYSVGGATRWLAVSSTGKVGYSDNSGASWTAATTVPTLGTLARRPIAVFGAGPQLWIMNAAGSLFRSTDGGVTWATRGSVPFTGTNPALSLGASADYLIAGGTGGQYWRYQTPFSYGIVSLGVSDDISFVGYSTDIGYVAGTDAQTMLRSTDGLVWFIAGLPFTSGSVYGFSSDGTTSVAACSNGELAYTGAIASYSTLADMLDDDQAPEPGTVGLYLGGGYFRLGSSPVGELTADIVQGSAASDRTAGQLLVAVMGQAGLATGDWSADDITALDAANSAVLGYWSGLEETTCAAVADQIMTSIIGWWGADELGVVRAQILIDPATANSAKTIEDRHIDKSGKTSTLKRKRTGDSGQGMPAYKAVVSYAKNYTVQTNGLFGAVTQSRRERLAREYLESTLNSAGVQASNPLAVQLSRETLLTTATDAASVASDMLALFAASGAFYEFDTEYDSDLKIGTTITLQISRYGLSAGKQLLIMKRVVDPSAALPTMTLGCWTNDLTSGYYYLAYAGDGWYLSTASDDQAATFTSDGDGLYIDNTNTTGGLLGRVRPVGMSVLSAPSA